MRSGAKAKTVWGSVFAALAAFLLVGLLALAVAVGAVPLARGGRALSVHIDSMSPVFNRGDLIVVRGTDEPASIEPGQIVSYRTAAGSSVVTRRFVETDTAGDSPHLVTRSGAGPDREESVVPVGQVVGVYLYRIPKLGYAVTWLGEHGLIALLAALVIVLCLVVGIVLMARQRGGRAAVDPRHKAPGRGDRSPESPDRIPRPVAAGGDVPSTSGADAVGPGSKIPSWPKTDAAQTGPITRVSASAAWAATGNDVAAPFPRRRAGAKRADLTDTLGGTEVTARKPVPWRPGPASAGETSASRAPNQVPTWEDVSPHAQSAPPTDRLVTTRPDTLARPVAFVPTGPAMEGRSTGQLPVRRPRQVGETPSIALLIPHARVSANATGELPVAEAQSTSKPAPAPGSQPTEPPDRTASAERTALPELAALPEPAVSPEAGPAVPARRDRSAPIASRIPRAQTPPQPGPDLPAVMIQRAVSSESVAAQSAASNEWDQGNSDRTRGQSAAEASPFESLRQRAAQAMHESGELRLVRDSAKPRVIAHQGGAPDDAPPWLSALDSRRDR
ncbi:MAG: signal peptidase I [Bifidobacteriaceae bacterium]|nr:signal peptidase I [Bifidobacteriaceae bacterium]